MSFFLLEKVDKKEKYYIFLGCVCNSVSGTIVLFEFHGYEIKKNNSIKADYAKHESFAY